MDTELSLDDIITKKKSTQPKGKRGGAAGRGGNANASGGVKTVLNKANNNVRKGAQGLRGGRGGISRVAPPIGDARSRIIQHKRLKITDAREKLGEIAKMSDARLKLNKLHGSETIGRGNAGPKLLTTKGGIMVQTGRNGQIELSTKKKMHAISPLNPFSLPGRSISTEYRDSVLPSLMELETQFEEDFEPLVIRRTVENRSALPTLPSFPPPRSRNAYSWKKPAYIDEDEEGFDRMAETMLRSQIMHEPNPLQRLPVKNVRLQPRMAPANIKPSHEWYQHDHEPPSPKRAAPTVRPRPLQSRSQVVYSDGEDDEPMTYPRGSFSAARSGGGVKARLDAAKPVSRSMGILSAEARAMPRVAPRAAPERSTAVRVAAVRSQIPSSENHRIVVSNLQKSVTNEDIRELFEDVGSLVSSKLVRPGTAEVVYRSRKDAMNAVEIYHNRQLDGEPMKCMLVNHRPPQTPTQPMSSRTASTAHFRGATSARFPTTKSQKPTVYPDVDTIHKVLFSKRS